MKECFFWFIVCPKWTPQQHHEYQSCQEHSLTFSVCLSWRGLGPTTDSHGDSWLLGFPPGPVRPSLVNLAPPGSPGGPMLMQALVRTPDQHDPVTTRTPLLKSSLRTCLLVAGLQELATTPGNSKSRVGGWSRNLSVQLLTGADLTLRHKRSRRESGESRPVLQMELQPYLIFFY